MRVTFTVPAKYRGYIEGRLRDVQDDIGKHQMAESHPEGAGHAILPDFGLDPDLGVIRVTVEILPTR